MKENKQEFHEAEISKEGSCCICGSNYKLFSLKNTTSHICYECRQKILNAEGSFDKLPKNVNAIISLAMAKGWTREEALLVWARNNDNLEWAQINVMAARNPYNGRITNMYSAYAVGRFRDLSPQEKKAVEKLMQEENLDYGFAYNVLSNRYSLKVAKEKQRLKNREIQGKSTDAFVLGRRVNGSFGSGKRK